MSVRTTCADGVQRTEAKMFVIRAAENYYGRWRYQLNYADTGQPYLGSTWFGEDNLQPVVE